jgi:integrase
LTKSPQLWLSEADTSKILNAAKSQSIRDWLILELCRHGLRDGEILGRRQLPGIYVRDLRETGIWLIGKGYSQEAPSLYDLPKWLILELKQFSDQWGRGPRAKLFDLSVRQLERLVKRYARIAGVEDWDLVKPHRLRAFFATDLKDRDVDSFTIRDMMRHKNITTTNLYVGRGTPERRAKIMETLTPMAARPHPF